MLSNTSGWRPLYYAMNARISKLVDDKYYSLLKGLVDLAKVWLSLFHYQVIWQKILILQYDFVSLEYFLFVFCIHFPKLICHKKYKDKLDYSIFVLVI